VTNQINRAPGSDQARHDDTVTILKLSDCFGLVKP